jgi:signal recognition particle subunit SRP54
MRKMFKGIGKGNVLQRRAMGMMGGMRGMGR